MNELLRIICGDALTELRKLEAESVQCCVTSPPYWGLRDYGVAGQIGLESTAQEYVSRMVEVFREVKRVLRENGTLWLNLGDSYGANYRGGGPRGASDKQLSNGGSVAFMGRNGMASKQLIGIPWRVAFALQADGWWLRSDIIWSKPNPMPESVTDRPTKAHEYLFLMSNSERYYYDQEAIKEQSEESSGWAKQRANGHNTWEYNDTPERIAITGQRIESSTLGTAGYRNKRSVWTVTTSPYPEAHFATFPPDLIKPCILAGTKPGDTVLDPFFGSGTTGMVSLELGRRCIGIELNPEYVKLAEQRCFVTPGLPF